MEKEAGHEVDPVVKQAVSRQKLKEFADRGGYALLESVGEGATPEEKQMNAWKKHGIFKRLLEKTGISKPTLYKIAASCPCMKSTNLPQGKYIRAEDCEDLKDACSELLEAERSLESVLKQLAHSVIVDFTEIRAAQQIGGVSPEESLRSILARQLDSREQDLWGVDRTIDKALGSVRQAFRSISSVSRNAI